MEYKVIFSAVSIFFGFISAFSWFYASRVKVSDEQAVALIKKRAKKNNETADYSRMTFDGWDFRETLQAQSKWNSYGAIFASISMITQVILQIFF